MTRFALTIEYDGRPFMGWQHQDHGPSVQQAIEDAAHAITGEHALVHAAGCTAPNHEDCRDFHRLMQIATGREPRHGTPPAPARPAPFAGDRGPEDS